MLCVQNLYLTTPLNGLQGTDAASSDIPGEFTDMPEMKPLSNRFSFFEHFEEKKEAEEEKQRRQKGQRKAARGAQIHPSLQPHCIVTSYLDFFSGI